MKCTRGDTKFINNYQSFPIFKFTGKLFLYITDSLILTT